LTESFGTARTGHLGACRVEAAASRGLVGGGRLWIGGGDAGCGARQKRTRLVMACPGLVQRSVTGRGCCGAPRPRVSRPSYGFVNHSCCISRPTEPNGLGGPPSACGKSQAGGPHDRPLGTIGRLYEGCLIEGPDLEQHNGPSTTRRVALQAQPASLAPTSLQPSNETVGIAIDHWRAKAACEGRFQTSCGVRSCSVDGLERASSGTVSEAASAALGRLGQSFRAPVARAATR
jgi:hypothetical protein